MYWLPKMYHKTPTGARIIVAQTTLGYNIQKQYSFPIVTKLNKINV